MDIKYELLANTLSTMAKEKIETAFDDLENWSNATAMVMLYEIWGITEDKNLSSSDMVKQIKEVYKKHNVDLNIHSSK